MLENFGNNAIEMNGLVTHSWCIEHVSKDDITNI